MFKVGESVLLKLSGRLFKARITTIQNAAVSAYPYVVIYYLEGRNRYYPAYEYELLPIIDGNDILKGML